MIVKTTKHLFTPFLKLPQTPFLVVQVGLKEHSYKSHKTLKLKLSMLHFFVVSLGLTLVVNGHLEGKVFEPLSFFIFNKVTWIHQIHEYNYQFNIKTLKYCDVALEEPHEWVDRPVSGLLYFLQVGTL